MLSNYAPSAHSFDYADGVAGIISKTGILLMLHDMLWVGIGGFLGANSRYFVSTWIAKSIDAALPWGTLVVNVTGSMLIGAFLLWTSDRVLTDPDLRLLVAVGFCGSYTTFSSFAYETVILFEQGHWLDAAGSILLNNVLALTSVLLGMVLVRWLTSWHW